MKKILKIFFATLAIFALLSLSVFLYFKYDLINLSEVELEEFIQSKGSLAPLIFIFISFLQVTLVPIPGAITILAGEVLFGFWHSFLYSYIGMMCGSVFAFFLGRKIGRPFINMLAGGKDKAEEWIAKLKGKETVVLFFMFLLPMFPDDLLCSIAGLLSFSYFGFILMQIITRMTSIGATLLFMSGNLIPYSGWGIPVLIFLGLLCIVAFVLSMKYSDHINRSVENVANKVKKFLKK